jgi:hypothetical protein
MRRLEESAIDGPRFGASSRSNSLVVVTVTARVMDTPAIDADPIRIVEKTLSTRAHDSTSTQVESATWKMPADEVSIGLFASYTANGAVHGSIASTTNRIAASRLTINEGDYNTQDSPNGIDLSFAFPLINFFRARHRIATTLTAEEHLKMLADVVVRLNALHEELTSLETRIAAQRTLIAQDIAFIQQRRDHLNSRKS